MWTKRRVGGECECIFANDVLVLQICFVLHLTTHGPDGNLNFENIDSKTVSKRYLQISVCLFKFVNEIFVTIKDLEGVDTSLDNKPKN